MLDVINLANVSLPSMVILCFKHNQEALSSLCTLLPKANVPIVCLIQSHESNRLKWPKNRIVFTYPIEQVVKGSYLAPRLQSILLMADSKSESQNSFGRGPSLAQQRISENKSLSRYVMELEQKKEILKKVRSQLCLLFPEAKDQMRQKLVSIANTIKVANNDQNHWEDFKMYFENVSPSFIARLSARHPGLTSKDIKYCCYLLMSMSNTDIGHLLGINLESVRTHKYRLKKKLHVQKDASLHHYIKSL